MNDRFREILDSLPAPIPRSCLEPYKELIQELRRRKRSYREIAHVLGEKCGVRVSHSTLHEFVQRHLSTGPVEDCARPRAVSNAAPRHLEETRAAKRDEVRERIEALKRKSAIRPDQPETFRFDRTEPLRLKSGKP
jgi:IS30 family transposase